MIIALVLLFLLLSNSMASILLIRKINASWIMLTHDLAFIWRRWKRQMQCLCWRCLCSWNPAKTVAFNWLRPVLLTVKRLMKIRIFRNQQIRIERQSLSYGFHCFMAVERIRKSNRCLPFPFGLPSWCHRRVWFNRTIIDQTVFHIWRSV